LEKLGINLPSLLVQVINFIVLFVILSLVAYKPILKMLDNRKTRIKESMAQVEETKEKAAHAEADAKAQIDEARKQREMIIAQADDAAEGIREEARLQAKQDAEAILAKAKDEIDREAEKTKDELRKEVADISIMAAEKVIRKTLDKEAHRRLIEEVVEESPLLKKE
jgi:F-type H+-transporting ATPase subunit b